MKLTITPVVARKKIAKHVLSSEEGGDWNILVNGLLTKLCSALRKEGKSLDGVRERLDDNNHDSTFDKTLGPLKDALLAVLHRTVYESKDRNFRVEKEDAILGFGLTGVIMVTKCRSDSSASETHLTTFFLPRIHEAAPEILRNWTNPTSEALEHMIHRECYRRSVSNIYKMRPSRFASRADCCDLSKLIPLEKDYPVGKWMEDRKRIAEIWRKMHAR
jgi:hypothetical protein